MPEQMPVHSKSHDTAIAQEQSKSKPDHRNRAEYTAAELRKTPQPEKVHHKTRVMVAKEAKEAKEAEVEVSALRKKLHGEEEAQPSTRLQKKIARANEEEGNIQEEINRLKGSVGVFGKFKNWLGGLTGGRSETPQQMQLNRLQERLQEIDARRNADMEELQMLRYQGGIEKAVGIPRKMSMTPEKTLKKEGRDRTERLEAEKMFGAATEKSAEELEKEYLGEEEVSGVFEIPESRREQTVKRMEKEDEEIGKIEIPEAARKKILKRMEDEEIEKIDKGWDEIESDKKKAIEPPAIVFEQGKKAAAEMNKRLKPMTIEHASSLVPDASKLWDLANSNLKKHPDAAMAFEAHKQFGAKGVEGDPATLFVYAIAKHAEAMKTGDDKLADEYRDKVEELSKALGLEHNALIKKSLAEKAVHSDVLKGTRQRQANVARRNARWKT